MTKEDQKFLQAAINEAEKGFAEGGLPIGSVLVFDGEIVARGRNRRIQDGSPILHAEMDCIEKAGRLKPEIYRRSTLYSTLSPCDMCSGAVLLYKIPRVVIGENESFKGPEEYVSSRGVQLVLADNPVCKALMARLISTRPEDWLEDIGELDQQ